uniref:Proteasome subunit beta n=1 Tax=Cyprinus carpio TaxID=7962 RepID=A0A8C2J0G4_CYPCA
IMATASVCQYHRGGFSFENCKRNALLEADINKLGFSSPAARKTGTTICGVVYKDGVVLGADTRATEGMVVADKNCSKIHYISPNVYCCGAGTAADTEMTTQIISSNLELHSLSTGRLPRVATANRMLKQMLFSFLLMHYACKLVKTHMNSLFHCSKDNDDAGCVDQEEEAKRLVRDAIAAGIFNDLGSGSNIDLCVITKGKVDYLRPHDVANKKGVRTGNYRYKHGTTGVLAKTVTPLNLEVVEENVQTMDNPLSCFNLN